MRGPIVLTASFLSLLGLGVLGASMQSPVSQGSQGETAPGALERLDPGTFPDEWIHGGDCANDPLIQRHAYNDDLYILRQSKCDTGEAPFLFLIFGDDRALLIDSGAKRTSPVKGTVDRIVDEWLARKGKTSIDLIQGHSHSHGDHIAGDQQFAGQPGVTHVGHGVANVQAFYGIASWPDDVGALDLGGRVLDVLATPGHKDDSVTFYDRRTGLLFTGDIVYPGHLFVFTQAEWPDFQKSLARLDEWAKSHPVSHVLGCHVEYSAVPGVPYRYGTSVQPDEHVLQLAPSVLGKIRTAAEAMGATPQCKVFDEFVIQPVWLCGIGFN